jgi:hypothetical protein
MRTFYLVVFVAIGLITCSTRYAVREEFEEGLKRYNNMLVFNELDAASLFVTESLSDEFMSRVEAAKDVRVVDYRIVSTKYDEAKGEAEVKVEIDYYSLSSLKVKTLLDTQKWVYVKEKGKKQWRLMSILPEFR